MQQRLPRDLLAFLRSAGEAAEAQGNRLYLVGGAVRDLILERPNLDYDLVVEGDAPRLARRLAKSGGGKVTIHRQFGTAKFSRGENSVDLVTARSETYERPGALPTTRPGDIGDDLGRRDFSINAMAIHLGAADFGRLLDPHAGMGDIEAGLIRILHDSSFVDDATRMLRALRYEQRLDFRLEADTERLLQEHASMLDTISGDRLRHELELIFKESHPERVLERADGLGVLSAIHPALRLDSSLAERFSLARESGLPDPVLYLLLLIYHLSEDEVDGVIERLSISGELGRSMRQVPWLREDIALLAEPSVRPSAVYHLLENYNPAAIAACALGDDAPAIRLQLERYLNELRYVKTHLDGDDLKRMGVAAGPRLGKILNRLREARLDGQATSRRDEEALVRQWLQQR